MCLGDAFCGRNVAVRGLENDHKISAWFCYKFAGFIVESVAHRRGRENIC